MFRANHLANTLELWGQGVVTKLLGLVVQGGLVLPAVMFWGCAR